MSVDLDWEQLTGGPDGEALAESIRAFIDHRFQQVALPKMISAVKVHSFEFGSVPPELELKDVSDPLPDFYEDEDEDEDEDDEDEDEDDNNGNDNGGAPVDQPTIPLDGFTQARGQQPGVDQKSVRGLPNRRSSIDRKPLAPPESQIPSAASVRPPLNVPRPPLSRSSTPGIPGGTSNLSYFHLPLSAGLSGAATPFGAFGGPHGWLEQAHGPWHHHETGPADRRLSSPEATSNNMQDLDDKLEAIPETPKEKASEDLQIVTHVRYSGDIKLTLSADILLDYPMPSFAGIPLQLKVTGMTFDGIAILAYIKHKAHFCFLSPEDADALVGGYTSNSDDEDSQKSQQTHKPVGKLFEQIRVESEIGRRASGKQSLKNVSKVEKFVLEQVRRIFENEFVYPSFWTFLV